MGLSENLKSFGKQALDSVASARYNHSSQKSALQVLAHIEKHYGKLDTARKKLADTYAHEVLGWKGYAPWLYVYSAVTGKFEEGWMPDNYYHTIILPKIQGDYGRISFLKPLNNTIFNASVSPDRAYFINGHWFDRNFKQITREFLKNTVLGADQKWVYKVDQSYQGRGVFLYKRDNLDIAGLEKNGNGTLQTYIEQHPFFDAFRSYAVANIRLTTVTTNDGSPSLRASYLRLGRTTDTHVQSDSHIRVPVGLQTGNLYDEAFLADWERIRFHPDSGVEFANSTIPLYQNCVALVLKLHQRMPMVRAIGWDVVVDKENNPIIMEWNGYGNDIKFSEATQGPCFKDLDWNPYRQA